MPKKRKQIYVLPENKECSHCNILKPKDEFRTRWERRVEPAFPYLNNTCKKCDTELTHLAHKTRRKTPEGKEKNRKWAKASYYNRRQKAIEYMKKTRQTEEYKKRRKDYIEKNKSKIYKQELITKRRYHEKNRDNLTDVYISNQLKSQGVASQEIIELCPQLIEAKRLQILIKREIKNHGNKESGNKH